MTQKEKLIELLNSYFTIGDSYAYNLTRVKEAFAIGTVDIDDFVEFDEEITADIADYLLENGVIVPPCKVGDTVWLVIVEKENNDWYILEDVVDRFVRYDRIQFVFDMKRFGYLHVDRESNNLIDSLYDGCICSTKEEAEKALAEKRADNGMDKR